AVLLKLVAEETALWELARRSRGTPRVANRLLRRVRDFAAVEGNGKVTLPITKSALELAAIDEKGLDDQDRTFLRTMIEVYEGGPVGIEAVAATMGEERDTLEDVIEPYLLQNAFVTRTRQGRRATKLAYEHLGMKYPKRPRTEGLFSDEEPGVEPVA
ncbi:MAG: ruvB 1, partial [Phycisphaerales bacterium]|nr:ruvB 1 [Phycisphaerales bacterium]